MRAAVLAAVVLAGIAAGCGGSEEAQVRDRTKAFVDAIRAHDGKRACSYLTDNGRSVYTQLGDVPCNQGVVATALPPGAKVGKVSVHGDQATAALVGTGGAPPVIVVLKKQGGSWKVDSTG